MIRQSISSEAEASRERVTPQSETEIVLLIHGSAESRNSCNGAGGCGVIGTMSGRTEST